MKTLTRILLLFAGALSLHAGEPAASVLGSPDFKPSADRPVGWRGDWTGRYPGATPPTTWSRRVHGATTVLRYQASKPTGEAPTKESRPLEYFSIKDWLVSGPYNVSDPVKDIDQDFLGGEPAVQPSETGKGAASWKY